jgi:hypothetical protein
MTSVESSCQEGVLTYGEEAEERSHSYQDPCGTASYVNEDDDKLETFFIEEKGQRRILVIGGIQIFVPIILGETSTGVAYAIEGQRIDTVMEEKDKILKSIPMEEEHPIESITHWEMDLNRFKYCLRNPELEGGFHEIPMNMIS